jgi:cytochrome c peroxidase
MFLLSCAALLHGQHDAQPASKAVLQAELGERNDDGSRRSIKTFPLLGIKDTPPYLHDGRLLTLDDTVEYFNLVLDRKLTDSEKADLVAFLRAL